VKNLQEYLKLFTNEMSSDVIEKLRAHFMAEGLLTSFSKYNAEESLQYYQKSDKDIKEKAQLLETTNPSQFRRIVSQVKMGYHKKSGSPFFLPVHTNSITTTALHNGCDNTSHINSS